MADSMNNAYFENECFPVKKLQSKIAEFMYPYVLVESTDLVKKDRRTRLHVNLKSKNGERKTITLLLSIKYPPLLENGEKDLKTPAKYYINNKSFENAVNGLQRAKNMKRDLAAQMNITLHDGDDFSREIVGDFEGI